MIRERDWLIGRKYKVELKFDFKFLKTIRAANGIITACSPLFILSDYI